MKLIRRALVALVVFALAACASGGDRTDDRTDDRGRGGRSLTEEVEP